MRILRSGFALARRPAVTHAAVPPPQKMMSISPMDSLYSAVAILKDGIQDVREKVKGMGEIRIKKT
jgi:hypothetical protein